MKKLVILSLIAPAVLGLAACGEKKVDGNDTAVNATVADENLTDGANLTDENLTDGNVAGNVQ